MALGVDVMQIDDGWQKGRSANFVAARGTAKITDNTLTVNVPERLDFVWVKLE